MCIVYMLCDVGVEVNAVDGCGSTPLHHAARRGVLGGRGREREEGVLGVEEREEGVWGVKERERERERKVCWDERERGGCVGGERERERKVCWG